MQGFGNIDEVGGLAVHNACIEATDIIYAYNTVEIHIVGESLIHFFLRDILRRTYRVRRVEGHKKKALLVPDEVEYVDMTRRGGEGTVITVADITQRVIRGVELACGAQELALGVKAAVLEHTLDVVGQFLMAEERFVGSRQFTHAGEYGIDNFLRHIVVSAQTAIVAVTD